MMNMGRLDWAGIRVRWASRALLAIGVDAALVGAGLAAAAGAVVFAGVMIAGGDHKPDVPGQKYLAIFAQPRKAGRVAEDPPPTLAPPARGGLDMAPVGAIGAAATIGAAGFSLIGAQPGVAWLRQDRRVVAVRVGDVAPGLGRIVEIVQRDGRWYLIGDSGAALLSSEPAAPRRASPRRAPFGRPMIFGDEE